jgi:tRNA 2-selenouridine synthase
MRSERFANFLNEHEYKTHTLVNGYKSYRHSVLESFSEYLDLVLIGGETGSGKTEILKKMEEKGELVIDLEGLAHHKGSAFGSLGENPQPKQEQFENNLAQELSRVRLQGKVVWLEDEARTIGVCHLPNPLWEKMKAAPIVRLNIPKEERIERLVDDYGNYSKEELSGCILKIQKRLGPQHAKRALEELEIGNLRAVADISLTYYDKAYNYNHELRNFKDVFIVECLSSDASVNVVKVLDCAHNKNSKNNV